MAAKKAKKSETKAATLDHFPPDTKVDVFVKTGDSFDGGGRGKKVESVQVGTDGSLVLKGLDEDAEYWAVGDDGRVVAFIAADPNPKGRLRGRAAQPSAGNSERSSSTPGPDEAERPSGGAAPISATQQGGSGRSLTSHDEKLTGREQDATQLPPKKKSSGKKSAAKKSATSGRKGAKGVRGARGTTSRKS